jgi:hypothetical protein
MRTALWVLLLLVPGLALGQSLGEVAKKERERRERNKQQGKEAIVISEEDLSGPTQGGSGIVEVQGGSAGTRPTVGPARLSSEEEGEDEEYDEEADYAEEDVPQSIPSSLPLEQKLEMFQRMRRYYDQQVREIDNAIAENNERLRQIEARIGATQALGGGGLPVAPQTGTGAATAPMTGQETQQLVAEQQQLQRMNQQMEARKEQLKGDLQTKGRAAGIPPGYLRF